MMSVTRRSAPFGERVAFFVRPLPLSAVAVMALNDHCLKWAHPSWFTGKLSDVAGVFFFPLLFSALGILLEWSFAPRHAPAGLTRARLWVGMGVTALVMVLLKLVAPFSQAVEALFLGFGVAIRITVDPTDLGALTVLPLTYGYARKFIVTHSR